MEVEEEFLKNATTMVRFAEEEIKQFLAWTGKRSPCSRTAEEIAGKLQLLATDLKLLKSTYTAVPKGSSYMQMQAATHAS